MALLWQASAAAVPTYCSMGDEVGGLATTFQDAAEHPDHQAMGHAGDEHHEKGDCCGGDKSEKGCVMPGCAVPMQLLTSTLVATVVLDSPTTGTASHPIVFPPAPIFPFLRPPIA